MGARLVSDIPDSERLWSQAETERESDELLV